MRKGLTSYAHRLGESMLSTCQLSSLGSTHSIWAQWKCHLAAYLSISKLTLKYVLNGEPSDQPAQIEGEYSVGEWTLLILKTHQDTSVIGIGCLWTEGQNSGQMTNGETEKLEVHSLLGTELRLVVTAQSYTEASWSHTAMRISNGQDWN